MGRLWLGCAGGGLKVCEVNFREKERGENRGEEEETTKMLIQNKFAQYFTVKTPLLWNTTRQMM